MILISLGLGYCVSQSNLRVMSSTIGLLILASLIISITFDSVHIHQQQTGLVFKFSLGLVLVLLILELLEHGIAQTLIQPQAQPA